MGRLDGKVAFITGAARGQGRSHAVGLAREGAAIIAVDVCKPVATVPYPASTSEDLVETVRLVEGAGGRILAAEADVRDLAELQRIADQGVEEFGSLDIVVANAGIAVPAPAIEMDEETWSTTIDINLTGVWKTAKATVPHIRAGGRGGAVVFIGSLSAVITNANTAQYAATKEGMVGLMRVMAKELAEESIRVNIIHPGTVATPMVYNEANYRLFRPDLENPGREDFDLAARTLNALPVAAAEPEDITNAVMYLVSEEGRYVTGTALEVGAGGQLAGVGG